MPICQLCEVRPRKRGSIIVFENTVIEPPVRMEVCRSCHIWMTRKFRRYSIDKMNKQVKKVKPKQKKEIKKKRKLYKR